MHNSLLTFPSVFNPGAAPVSLKKGAVAGVLQVVEMAAPPSFKVPTAAETVHDSSAPVPLHLQVVYSESCTSLPKAERGRLPASYNPTVMFSSRGQVTSGLMQHDILTTPGPPVRQQPRRLVRDKQNTADQQMQWSLGVGIAQPSNGSWAALIVMVQKKDQSPPLCVDYRPLNERTFKDAYPLS